MKHQSSSVHQFKSLNDCAFTAIEYSQLKFGSDKIARKFGYELAVDFFSKHSDTLLANNCVVIPSPYNHVKNAATIMTEHFINKLNELLVAANGNHVEYSIIHRKVSYISDYGFLSKEKRRGLIDNDSFYLNKEFYKDKVLIFVDDVKITGTHEDKLVEILAKNKIKNDCFFLYFAEYKGSDPKIEAALNFAGINTLEDYIKLFCDYDHNVIVRPIKYLLGSKDSIGIKEFFAHAAKHRIHHKRLMEVYYGALGEGYYKIPNYQTNFKILSDVVKGIKL